MRQARVVYEGRTLTATPCTTGVRLADGTELREEQVTWLPPAEFGTIFALGLNYADHVRELKFQKAPGFSSGSGLFRDEGASAEAG